MRRLLALVAAAGMVAGSIAIRSRLDRGEEDRSNPVRVVCAAELGAVCDSLRQTAAQVSVEPAGTTADRLGRSSAEDHGLDGWLVPAPWPQIVDGRRRLQALVPLFPEVSAPLARSPLVLVVRRMLAESLAPRCGGTVGWKCLGDAAGAGQAKPGHADPAADALGTLVVGQATAAFFERVDDLSTLDLDDPEFARWFRGLERATPPLASGGSPLGEMLGTNFAVYDAVGTIEAEAAPVLAASAVRDRVVLLYPAPMATADVVLAGTGGNAARRLRNVAGGDTTRRALAGAGWRVEGMTRTTEPPLPSTSGLPSAGFLDTLRSRAQEVRR
ncbi:MAG: substrate-binding domain-containing protein [Actinomycetota bacterium]|nr:substrate-binding domain-containing protein [Actinomycetota bacterium]